MHWPTELQLEEWYFEILATTEATTPGIAKAVSNLSSAVTSASLRRSICERCEKEDSGLNRLTQMLSRGVRKNFKPTQEHHAFTPRLTRRLEDAVWGRGNQSTTIISEIDHWLKQKIPNGTWEEKILIGFVVGKGMEINYTTRGHSRFFAVVFVMYWILLASHAVDQDKVRLLTPARYIKPLAYGHRSSAAEERVGTLSIRRTTSTLKRRCIRPRVSLIKNEPREVQELTQINTPAHTTTRPTCK